MRFVKRRLIYSSMSTPCLSFSFDLFRLFSFFFFFIQLSSFQYLGCGPFCSLPCWPSSSLFPLHSMCQGKISTPQVLRKEHVITIFPREFFYRLIWKEDIKIDEMVKGHKTLLYNGYLLLMFLNSHCLFKKKENKQTNNLQTRKTRVQCRWSHTKIWQKSEFPSRGQFSPNQLKFLIIVAGPCSSLWSKVKLPFFVVDTDINCPCV